MKQFKTVFLYELHTTLRNKIFLGFTIAVGLIAILILTVPPVISNLGLFSSSSTEGALQDVRIVDKAGLITDAASFAGEFEGIYNLKIEADPSSLTKQALMEQVDSQEIYAALLIEQGGSAVLIQKPAMYSEAGDLFSEALQTQAQIKIMSESGMEAQQIEQALAPISFTVEETGRSFMETYWYTYILLILLYLTVNMYGQLVASSVVTEKSSRAMELLVSSAKPSNLMFGKIFGVGLAGLIQLGIWIACTVGAYTLNADYWSMSMLASFFNIPPYVVVYMVVFYILGFFSFAVLYAAIGSLVSRAEDISTVSMPLVLLFMLGFFVSIFGMTAPESMVLKVFSFIPIYTPMCMFVRICTTDVAIWEIAVSITLTAAFTLFACRLAAKIYRMGVLMYGNAPSFGALFKTLRQSKKY